MDYLIDWMERASIYFRSLTNPDAHNPLASRLQFGAHRLDVIYGNEKLKNLFHKAFSHIQIPITDNNRVFTIFVTDNTCKSPGISMTKMATNHDSEKEIITFNRNDLHFMINPKSQIISYVDMENEIAVYAISETENIPYFEIAAPMRYILHWYCEKYNKTLIHAAAIGAGSKAVLITGPGGSGKSSTSLSCALKGMDYLGDDYVLVENENEPQVISVYNSVKFRWDSTERIPQLKQIAKTVKSNEEKGYFFLQDHSYCSVKSKMPIAALLFAVIDNQGKTTFAADESQKILLNLAASTIFQMPGSGRATLKNIIRILGKLPVYRMSLGTEPDEIAESIRNFMKSLP